VHGIDIPVAADGLLAEFAQAGVIGWSGVHLARTLGRLVGENRPEVLLAAALCLRAQEAGSVCLPLDDVVQTTAVEPEQDQMPDQIPPPGELPWPGVDEWLAMLASSPLVAVGEQVAENRFPLRLVERRVYLERNWQAEEDVRWGLLTRLDASPPQVDQGALDAAVDRAFEAFGIPAGASARPKDAVRNCVKSWTSVIAGGPGTGKTTTIGKIARLLVAEGRTVVLGAADTFRAAAADQLETWGSRVGVPTVRGPEGGDPASVAFDAVVRGIELGVDVVLVDTAGRLHTKTGLMDELGKIKRVIEKKAPVTEVLLVIDATTGQNGLIQARIFSEVVAVTGIVLSKLDGSAKGGIVVQVQRELGVPVKLVGLGEGADDLAPFTADGFVDGLLGR